MGREYRVKEEIRNQKQMIRQKKMGTVVRQSPRVPRRGNCRWGTLLDVELLVRDVSTGAHNYEI